ncbi:MAG TPA: dTMP kinase [candidate division WOR-3 bacterium]|uniref:Thymidylate kinase n=1 Tax=candidate division WOR-3 bacterium TaxID=2052148 RepID=A0A9C9EPH1_UNCW3|nr:dTMP kinase [candidate division WOR-3 bacterium]
MHGVKRGVFISFEGVEGSGKTTQAEALSGWLSEKNIPHIFVREPGGTAVGEALRKILLNPAYREMHPKCELFLFLAARSQLTYEKILPAISAKKVVVADRFFDSTFAYQIYARNLPRRLVSIFNRFATAGIKPDLTFLFDIDVTKGRERGVFDDRMETEDVAYHQKVRKGYLKLAHRAKKRIKLLNGEKSIEQLKNEVIDYVKELLVRKGYLL